MSQVLTEASIKIVKKLRCWECENSHRLAWSSFADRPDSPSLEELTSNSSIASILLPDKLAKV